MDLMTIRAGDVVHRMAARVPVMKIECGVCRMTFQADERLCLGRDIVDINKGLIITGCLLARPGIRLHLFRRQSLNGKAAGAVAGFTVDQGHAGLF